MSGFVPFRRGAIRLHRLCSSGFHHSRLIAFEETPSHLQAAGRGRGDGPETVPPTSDTAQVRNESDGMSIAGASGRGRGAALSPPSTQLASPSLTADKRSAADDARFEDADESGVGGFNPLEGQQPSNDLASSQLSGFGRGQPLSNPGQGNSSPSLAGASGHAGEPTDMGGRGRGTSSEQQKQHFDVQGFMDEIVSGEPVQQVSVSARGRGIGLDPGLEKPAAFSSHSNREQRPELSQRGRGIPIEQQTSSNERTSWTRQALNDLRGARPYGRGQPLRSTDEQGMRRQTGDLDRRPRAPSGSEAQGRRPLAFPYDESLRKIGPVAQPRPHLPSSGRGAPTSVESTPPGAVQDDDADVDAEVIEDDVPLPLTGRGRGKLKAVAGLAPFEEDEPDLSLAEDQQGRRRKGLPARAQGRPKAGAPKGHRYRAEGEEEEEDGIARRLKKRGVLADSEAATALAVDEEGMQEEEEEMDDEDQSFGYIGDEERDDFGVGGHGPPEYWDIDEDEDEERKELEEGEEVEEGEEGEEYEEGEEDEEDEDEEEDEEGETEEERKKWLIEMRRKFEEGLAEDEPDEAEQEIMQGKKKKEGQFQFRPREEENEEAEDLAPFLEFQELYQEVQDQVRLIEHNLDMEFDPHLSLDFGGTPQPRGVDDMRPREMFESMKGELVKELNIKDEAEWELHMKSVTKEYKRLKKVAKKHDPFLLEASLETLLAENIARDDPAYDLIRKQLDVLQNNPGWPYTAKEKYLKQVIKDFA